jgi:hypothetical protein
MDDFEVPVGPFKYMFDVPRGRLRKRTQLVLSDLGSQRNMRRDMRIFIRCGYADAWVTCLSHDARCTWYDGSSSLYGSSSLRFDDLSVRPSQFRGMLHYSGPKSSCEREFILEAHVRQPVKFTFPTGQRTCRALFRKGDRYVTWQHDHLIVAQCFPWVDDESVAIVELRPLARWHAIHIMLDECLYYLVIPFAFAWRILSATIEWIWDRIYDLVDRS